MELLLCGLLAAASLVPVVSLRTRPPPSKDPFGVYDGHDLLQIIACNESHVAGLRQLLTSASCRILSEPGQLLLPGDGSCATAQYTCPPKASEKQPRGDGIQVLAEGVAGEVMRRHGSMFLMVPLDEENGRIDLNSGSSVFYDQFRNYGDILAHLRSLVKESRVPAEILELEPETVEERNIQAVRIRGQKWRPGDLRFVFTYTIHAREWIATMAGVYAVETTLKRVAADPERYERMELVFVPVSNPDGFIYSSTQDRYWRKNTGEYEGCFGVDLNRNFNFQFASVKEETGNEVFTCSETFHGDGPASEPETRALQALVGQAPVTVHLDFHSCGGFILGPWAYTQTDHPRQKEILELGHAMQKAIKSHQGSKYQFCTGNRCLYMVAGDMPDFTTASGALGFTIEMRPVTGKFAVFEDFAPPPAQILPNAEENYRAIEAAITWAETKSAR